jgi:phospholipid/cholesterol/gamma-HCH transport system substrate-binding protein
LRISNETKVGALTAIAITILVLGYNFLRGKNLFSKPKNIYAVYDNTMGLPNIAAPVFYKGLQIGVTGEKFELDERASKIVVPITLSKKILIPKNSVAIISGSALGISSSVIEIKPGNDYTKFIEPGDTLLTNAPSDLLNEVTKQLNPVLYQVGNAVHSLDSVLRIIARTFDANAKNNVQAILANVQKTTAGLITSSASLQQLLNTQSGALAGSLNNINSFTGNLVKNNDKINGIVDNLGKATTKFSELNVELTLTKLNQSIDELKGVIAKLNNENGSLGLMMKDATLYNRINGLTKSMNTLVDDFKVNPKRYLSIFGRKDKKIKPLDQPLNDTLNK